MNPTCKGFDYLVLDHEPLDSFHFIEIPSDILVEWYWIYSRIGWIFQEILYRKQGVLAKKNRVTSGETSWEPRQPCFFQIKTAIKRPGFLKAVCILKNSQVLLMSFPSLEHLVYLSIQLGMSSSQLINIFQRGRYTTNQEKTLGPDSIVDFPIENGPVEIVDLPIFIH